MPGSVRTLNRLKNAVRFFDASVEINIGVFTMMLAGRERFSDAWMIKRWRKPCPPFDVMISLPSLEWIRTQFPKTVYSGNQDQMVHAILDTIKGVDQATKMDLIKGGFLTGGNTALKKALLAQLEEYAD